MKSMKILKIFLIGILVTIMVGFIGFYIYTLDYYKAETVAIDILENDKDLVQYDDFIALIPEESKDIGIIFYPGGKVEYTAYLPLLQKLKEEGYTSVLIEMPFNLAMFGVNSANKVYDDFSHIDKWYIAGHSLGGATASMYASDNEEKIEGLILLGSYNYKDYIGKNTINIYGEFNSDLEKNFSEDETTIKILGGNHAYFGNYGEQKGDSVATITQDEQQSIAVEHMVNFIDNKN